MHIFHPMKYAEAKSRADILKALAHPIRILIVEALARKDICVSELNALADVDQSTISRHLSILKHAGIVSERKFGARVFYHLKSPCIIPAFDCATQVIKNELSQRKKLLLKSGKK